jgi:hypothetical protein
VKLKRLASGVYEIRTGYLGEAGVAETWASGADVTSREYWATHAFCWGYEATEPGSETDHCPW